MDKFVTRFLKVFFHGVTMVMECLLVAFGICGLSMIVYPHIEEGVKYSIDEFSRFFSENAANPVANWFGGIFNRIVETLTPYPWAYVAIIVLGVIVAIRGVRSGKRFIQKIDELFETSGVPTTTNHKPRVFMASNRAAAMAKASRKIGFGEVSHDEPHEGIEWGTISKRRG